jgi:hypothetical protein
MKLGGAANASIKKDSQDKDGENAPEEEWLSSSSSISEI